MGNFTHRDAARLKRMMADPWSRDNDMRHPAVSWMRGIGKQNNAGLGGGSAALNSGMALNLETGKQQAMKKGGAVKSKASKRADGCCVRGKTRA